MNVRCPNCGGTISFDMPTSYPDGYKHKVTCPTCGKMIQVNLPKRSESTVSVPAPQQPYGYGAPQQPAAPQSYAAPQAPQTYAAPQQHYAAPQPPYAAPQAYNPQAYNAPQAYGAPQPAYQQPGYYNPAPAGYGDAAPQKKYNGRLRGGMAMLFSIIMAVPFIISSMVANGLFELELPGILGSIPSWIAGYDGVTMLQRMIEVGFAEYFEALIASGDIMAMVTTLIPLLYFVLIAIAFLFGLISVCCGKWPKGGAIFWWLLIMLVSVFVLFSTPIMFLIEGVELDFGLWFKSLFDPDFGELMYVIIAALSLIVWLAITIDAGVNKKNKA